MEKNEFLAEFSKVFNQNPQYLINAGGRLEICGNHTDHNHGLCLVANCSLRIYAAVNRNLDKVRIKSKGYDFFEFSVNNLEVNEKEYGTTLALCKGIIFKLKELGYKVGGFDAYIESEIPDGSGVSSSAAVESLFGFIISCLYNDEKIPSLTIAKVGQFSENVFFHKPCGLLDQVGTSFNDCNFIDFKNINDPLIETLHFNLPVSIFLIKSVGNHSELTALYKAIPDSMKIGAKTLDNVEFLRDVEKENIYKEIENMSADEYVKKVCVHFFSENQNVMDAKYAILNNNLNEFFQAIRKSQNSSCINLRNTFVQNEYLGSPQNIIDELTPYLQENGAIRIHGGGFKGTVIAFVKNEFADTFEKHVIEKYGKDSVYKVFIPKKALNFEKL